MRDQLAIELHDAFGTVVASGRIDVNADAITVAELVEYDEAGVMTARVLPQRRAKLSEVPLVRAVLASNYVQDKPLNPNMPLYIVVGLP